MFAKAFMKIKAFFYWGNADTGKGDSLGILTFLRSYYIRYVNLGITLVFSLFFLILLYLCSSHINP